MFSAEILQSFGDFLKYILVYYEPDIKTDYKYSCISRSNVLMNI